MQHGQDRGHGHTLTSISSSSSFFLRRMLDSSSLSSWDKSSGTGEQTETDRNEAGWREGEVILLGLKPIYLQIRQQNTFLSHESVPATLLKTRQSEEEQQP